MAQFLVLDDFTNGSGITFTAGQVIDDGLYNLPQLRQSGLSDVPYLAGLMANAVAAFEAQRAINPAAENDLLGLVLRSLGGASLVMTSGGISVEDALASSGGGGGGCLIYKPGGTTEGNVYATEQELLDAYEASFGPMTIVVDTSQQSPAPFALPWANVRPDLTLSGILVNPLNKTEVLFSAGSVWNRLPRFTNNLKVDSDSPDPTWVLTSGLSALMVDELTLMSNTGPARGLIVLQGNGTGLFILVRDFALIQNGVVVYVDDPGVGVPVQIACSLAGTQPGVNQNVFASDPAANAFLSFDTVSDTSQLLTQQAGFGGTIQVGGAQPRTFFRPQTVFAGPGNTSASNGCIQPMDATAGIVNADLFGTTQAAPGESVIVQKVDGSPNPVTITPAGGETINGSSDPFVLWSQAEGGLFVSDGAGNWYGLRFGGAMTWPEASGSPFTAPFLAVLSRMNAVDLATAAANVAGTLPSAALTPNGATIMFQNASADAGFSIDITPDGTDTINGVNAVLSVTGAWASRTLRSNGADGWTVVASA